MPQLFEKVFSTSCLRFQNFQKVLKSIDLNGVGHPFWVHLRAKNRATPGCAPKRPAGQPRTPFLPVFLHFRVYRQPGYNESGIGKPCLILFLTESKIFILSRNVEYTEFSAVSIKRHRLYRHIKHFPPSAPSANGGLTR